MDPVTQKLFLAVWAGDANECRRLLDGGASQATINPRQLPQLERLLRKAGLSMADTDACTPLHVAARQGHAAVCALLLDRGATHAVNQRGATPLLIAAENGHAEVCKLLLDRGATHTADEDGRTPLFVAAEKNNAELCALLLDRGATHAPDNIGSTPLSNAAHWGHVDVCKVLLDRGATHAANHNAATPLYSAAYFGHYEACELLLKRGAKHTLKHFGGTPLHIAASHGHHEVCALLLDHGATHTPDKDGKTPLVVAAENGRAAVCAVLLGRGANLDADLATCEQFGWTEATAKLQPMRLRLERELAERLRREREQAEQERLEAERLHSERERAGREAEERAHREAAERVEHLASATRWANDNAAAAVSPPEAQLPHPTSQTGRGEVEMEPVTQQLFLAAWAGDANECRRLLNGGASQTGINPERQLPQLATLLREADCPSTAVENGVTPLYIAAFKGRYEVCALLLDRGATHAATQMGDTPLFIAAQSGHVAVCVLLLDRGATHAAKRWTTPLLIAAEREHREVCAVLLGRGATHAADEDGWTPLHVAARLGNAELCTLLLERGATNAATWDGATPLLIAARFGHIAVCALLLEREPDREAALEAALTACDDKGWAAAARLLRELGERLREPQVGRPAPTGHGPESLAVAAAAAHALPSLLAGNPQGTSSLARGPGTDTVRAAGPVVRVPGAAEPARELQPRVAELAAAAETLQQPPDSPAVVAALHQQIAALENRQRRAAARLELRPAEFTLEEEDVRSGGFGTVSRATYQGQAVALKRPLALQGDVRDSLLAQLRQEADALGAVQHTHVLRLLAVCTNRDAVDTNGRRIALGIVMPWMEKSLKELVESRPMPLWPRRVQWLRQVALGMRSLHSAGLVHSDLKAANVMIDDADKALGADLGLARTHDGDGDGDVAVTGGTVPWMAPELFEGAAATPASDVYAFGMLMYEVAMREQPWANAAPNKVPEFVLEGRRPRLAEDMVPHEDYEALYDRCCREDPGDRPTVSEISDALAVVRAKVAQVTTFSTKAKAQAAPWHVPDALRAQLPDAAVRVGRGGRSAQLTARHGEPGFDVLLRHVRVVIAPRGTARAAASLARPNIAAVTLVCNLTREMAFHAVCEQLERRYAGIEAAEHDFHPMWDQPEFVRSGMFTLRQSPEQIAWRRAVVERVRDTLPDWAEGRLARTRVVLAFHACRDADAAQRIIDTGFVALSTLDRGFFGQGFYFTPDLHHAAAAYSENGSIATVLACALVFGNPYPVTEHPHQRPDQPDSLLGGSPSLLGAANVPRYDAHVAVVQRRGAGSVYYPYPPSSWEDAAFVASHGSPVIEIAVFERAHVLPLAVLSIQRRV